MPARTSSTAARTLPPSAQTTLTNDTRSAKPPPLETFRFRTRELRPREAPRCAAPSRHAEPPHVPRTNAETWEEGGLPLPGSARAGHRARRKARATTRRFGQRGACDVQRRIPRRPNRVTRRFTGFSKVAPPRRRVPLTALRLFDRIKAHPQRRLHCTLGS